jgi:hypothetical protein
MIQLLPFILVVLLCVPRDELCIKSQIIHACQMIVRNKKAGKLISTAVNLKDKNHNNNNCVGLFCRPGSRLVQLFLCCVVVVVVVFSVVFFLSAALLSHTPSVSSVFFPLLLTSQTPQPLLCDVLIA